jgi:ribosome recycling factor
MDSEVNLYIEMAGSAMEDAIQHLQNELNKIRAGKASPSLVEGVMVNYYGSPTPISQVANVAVADARTVTIQPWEKKMIAVIEKGIFEANLGLTPMNDGILIRISIPPLTGERRIEFVKRSKAAGEDTKVGVRSARKEAMDGIKKAVKDGYSEDMGKRKEEETQTLTNKFIERIDKLIEAKEKEIMTV